MDSLVTIGAASTRSENVSSSMVAEEEAGTTQLEHTSSFVSHDEAEYMQEFLKSERRHQLNLKMIFHDVVLI